MASLAAALSDMAFILSANSAIFPLTLSATPDALRYMLSSSFLICSSVNWSRKRSRYSALDESLLSVAIGTALSRGGIQCSMFWVVMTAVGIS